jgi:hypothetical protein
MRKPFFRPFLLSLLLVAACNTAAPKIEEFTSEAGDFTIQAPIALTENSQSVETAVGPVEIHTFTAEDRNAAYVVAYSDYPAEMVSQSDPDALLSGSRDGAVQNVGGTLISEDKIEMDGNPGLELVIDAQTETGEEATVNARLFLFENRLYQVLVVVPKGEAESVDVDGFFESFKVQ